MNQLRPRILLLPLAAVIIAALCVYRINRVDRPNDADAALPSQPAPAFELYDQQSESVRLARYLGRHSVLIAFFDGRLGAENVTAIQRLASLKDRLSHSSVIVIGVSRALPQMHEKSLRTLGNEELNQSNQFVLVSDLDGAVHRLWGLPDEITGEQAFVFAVDRAGRVPVRNGKPAPVADLDATLRSLIGGL